MTPRRLARSFGGGVAVVLLAASCGSGSSAPLPPARPHVAATMRDFTFEVGNVRAGQVVFDVRNAGRRRHRLSLIPLPPELPHIREQLRGRERALVNTQAAVHDLLPGERGTFATALGPGRYAVICFNVEPDGTSHARKGMATEFMIR